jgi:hypothetical protein
MGRRCCSFHRGDKHITIDDDDDDDDDDDGTTLNRRRNMIQTLMQVVVLVISSSSYWAQAQIKYFDLGWLWLFRNVFIQSLPV